MDNKTKIELNEELLSLIGGGELLEYQKLLLDTLIPSYRKKYPDMSIDEYLDIFRQSYPEYNMPAKSEEKIAEIRDYIAHYWD